jgi:hypothetical protein
MMLQLHAHSTSNAVVATSIKSINESVEWMEVRTFGADDNTRPRVLLVGDSVSCGYFPDVASELNGRANVARFATSRGLGDPELFKQLALILDEYNFAVIHFNNGLHGWDYTEGDYRTAFPKLLQLLRQHAPGAKLIWATSTPVRLGAPDFKKFDPKNEHVQARNRIAAEFVGEAGIPTDDLYSLVVNHPEYTVDGWHYKPEAAVWQAKQVAHSSEPRCRDQPANDGFSFKRIRQIMFEPERIVGQDQLTTHRLRFDSDLLACQIVSGLGFGYVKVMSSAMPSGLSGESQPAFRCFSPSSLDINFHFQCNC